MITWRWRPASESRDVTDLVARAVSADQEMGFSTPAAGVSQLGTGHFELLAWMPARRGAPGDGGETSLAAYLLLAVTGDGSGEACLVTDPRYRSLGVATAILEGLGRPSAPDNGWPGAGLQRVRFWAVGSHPAAERLARRFGMRATGEVWRMRRRLTGTDPAASSMDRYSVRELGDLDLDLAKLTMTHFAGWRLPSAGRPSPATSDVVRSRVALTADGQVHGLVTLRASPHTATPGRTGLITAAAISADSEAPLLMRMLIIDAMLALASMNQESVEVALGAQHAELAALLRSLGFRHDQSDIRYELAESPRDMR